MPRLSPIAVYFENHIVIVRPIGIVEAHRPCVRGIRQHLVIVGHAPRIARKRPRQYERDWTVFQCAEQAWHLLLDGPAETIVSKASCEEARHCAHDRDDLPAAQFAKHITAGWRRIGVRRYRRAGAE